jgi:hypothetical protein
VTGRLVDLHIYRHREEVKQFNGRLTGLCMKSGPAILYLIIPQSSYNARHDTGTGT